MEAWQEVSKVSPEFLDSTMAPLRDCYTTVKAQRGLLTPVEKADVLIGRVRLIIELLEAMVI